VSKDIIIKKERVEHSINPLLLKMILIILKFYKRIQIFTINNSVGYIVHYTPLILLNDSIPKPPSDVAIMGNIG